MSVSRKVEREILKEEYLKKIIEMLSADEEEEQIIPFQPMVMQKPSVH